MLEGMQITVTRKAGEEGKLFGSVGTADVAESLTEAGAEVERQEVRLPADTIRQLGEFPIAIHLHAEVEANITLHVVTEE
jgi:large subunit ribosomal protein L9